MTRQLGDDQSAHVRAKPRRNATERRACGAEAVEENDRRQGPLPYSVVDVDAHARASFWAVGRKAKERGIRTKPKGPGRHHLLRTSRGERIRTSDP